MFYNIQNTIAPRYLCYLIPPSISKYNRLSIAYLLRIYCDTTIL